jgi:hypothetical protein
MSSYAVSMKAYKTAIFKLHNPSQRKRAMLRDALTRNHRAYTKLLDALLPEIETFAAVKRGKWRENAIAIRASLKARALPLALGAKAGVVSDIAGQLSSHIELRAEQENTSTPTAARLNGTQGDYLARLDALATIRSHGSPRKGDASMVTSSAAPAAGRAMPTARWPHPAHTAQPIC